MRFDTLSPTMRPLQTLTLEAFISHLSFKFLSIEDLRDPSRVSYTIRDVLMSAFAMMFFQHPSLLQFQRAMHEIHGKCNLQTVFEVSTLASDTQMREILDSVESEELRSLLPEFVEKVRLGRLALSLQDRLEG